VRLTEKENEREEIGDGERAEGGKGELKTERKRVLVQEVSQLVHYAHLAVVAVCCSVLQCVAVGCSGLQCVAVGCSVLQCVAVFCVAVCGDSRSRATANTCCSVLRSVAVCCSVL